MVALDRRRFAAAGFNHVRVDRALRQKPCVRQTARHIGKYAAKFRADNLAFLLRIRNAGEFREITIRRVDPDEVEIALGERRLYFIAFVFAHQPVIHKNAVELPRNRFR